MTEILDVTVHADKRKLWKQVKSKAKGCGSPLHWLVREPVKANSQIYLKAKEVDKKRGRLVSLKRLVFYLEYETLPLKNIYMACNIPNCVNPSHMRMSGWEDDPLFLDAIPDQIERGILYPDDAAKWFGYKKEEKQNDNKI